MSNLTEKQTDLSEFFNELSKEKVKAKKERQDKLDNPTSELSNLFAKLENALSETKKISETPFIQEVTEEKILSLDDQNKLEVFSNLVDSLNTPVKPVEVEEEVDETFIEPIPWPEPDAFLETTSVPEVKEEKISEVYTKAESTGNIIQDIVTSLDDMGERTEVKEEVDHIAALRSEFDKFRNLIQRHIANQDHSGAGGGEVRLEFLDDIQRASAKVDGKFLKYSSSDGKWIGADTVTGSHAITTLDIDGGTDIGAAIVDADLFIIDDGAGGTNRKTAASRLKTYIGAGAADDLVAGDAAVTLTTTSGNITIDAAATNTDIIFKGTDGGSDITMLTLDGSEAGAATFNDKIVATELDISGDVDVDGTLETDALTIGGVTLSETIADTVGAMVGSNTETGIAVTYEDSDNTIDFVLGAAQTTITSLLATDIKIGEDDQTKVDFETADEIHFYAANAEQVYVADGIFGPQTDSDVDLGTTGVRWKDAFIDTITTTGTITASGVITGTGFTAGSAVIAESELELLDGLTAGTAIASKVVTTDSNIDTTGQRNLTISGELDAATLDISGNADIDGTLEADAYTVDGTALNEYIADTVGAMVSSNTETNITVTYQDGDNTLDFVIGTLNQDTTGNAATATTLATARTIGGTSFDGSANIAVALSATATALANARTIGGTSFDGTANIAVALSATATALANARTIHGVSFDGTANIDLTEVVQDTVGAMFGSNTETGITVSYEDGDGTIDLVVGTLNQDTTGTADNFTVSANNSTDETVYPVFVDGATGSQGAESDTGLTYNPSSGNLTIGGELVAATLDISGNVDVDGTLEADAYTVDGTTLAEYIADTTGAMVSSNTETGIAVTYQDGDNTIDFAVDAAQTAITSIYNTSLAIGYGSSHANIDFGTDNRIVFDIDGTSQVLLLDGVFRPTTDSDVDLGSSAKYWKDAYIDTITTTGNVTVGGNFTVSGTTTTVNKVTVNVEDAFVFEGATDDAYETTFSVTDPTVDRVILLPNTSGEVQVTPPMTLNGTDGSSTNAGDYLVQNTSADENDRLIYEDATSDVIAVLASHGITLSGLGWNAFQFDNG